MERRRRRSLQTIEALRLYLETLAVRNRLAAAALVNEEGGLVAGTGDGVDLDKLALLGAVGADHPGRVAGLGDSSIPRSHIHTASILVRGYRFYFAGIGAVPPRLKSVPRALRRILFSTK